MKIEKSQAFAVPGGAASLGELFRAYMPTYNVQVHKSYLKQINLIPVKISECSIQPVRKCHGLCQSDGGCCGFFEGLAVDVDEPCARCSREEVGDGCP